MVEEAVGIYGTSPTKHLSALARLEGYELGQLNRAVDEDRSLVRIRCMRGSMHLLTPALLAPAVAATHPDLMKHYHRQTKKGGGEAVYEGLAARIHAVLDGRHLTSAEIRAEVDPDKAHGPYFQIFLARMGAECRVARAGTTGSWRSDRLRYARWDQWVPGDPKPLEMPAEDARRELARRYVEAYGPVSLADLKWWTGWLAGATKAAAEGLDLGQQGLATNRLEGVRLLPVWDVLMVAYKDRARLFDAAHADFIYDKMGNATSVVLADGRVAGIWDLGPTDDPLRVKVAPLGRWPERTWRLVGEQVERIGTLIGATEIAVERVDAPRNLRAAKKNAFLSPLK